jgi:hypothetical protein
MNKLTINEYFNLVNDKIKSGDFRIKRSPDFRNIEIQIKSPYLESINYFMYEYLKDRKDNRMRLLFDYIVVPNNTDVLFDFNEISFEDFFNFLIYIKVK